MVALSVKGERRSGGWLDGWGRTAILLIVGLQAVLGFLLINTGIADNGDFSRSMQWFIEKPVAFATNWPTDDAAWDLRFTKFWIDDWTLKPADARPPIESRSSAQLLNMAGMAANAIAGNTDYSLRIASIPARMLALAAFATLALALRVTIRNTALTCLALAAVSAILLDTGYAAFLNSFYEERASLLYLLVLVPSAILAFRESGGWIWKTMFAVALALFASSKAQFVPTPAILLVVLIAHAWGPVKRAPLPTAALFAVPQLLALIVTTGYSFGNVNAYNSLFIGALTFTDDPARHLDDFPPRAEHCVGVNAYAQSPCFKEVSPFATHGRTVELYLSDPLAFTAAIGFAADAMHDIDLPQYGKTHLGGTVAPIIAPTLWSGVKRLMPTGLPFLAVLVAASVALFPLSKRPGFKGIAIAAQFLLALTASQIVITVVGDGRAEIQKHLLVANLAFDLGLVLVLTLALAATLSRSSSTRPTSPGPSGS
ncbi:hypothetical protein N825_14165 [Skermanella stibiiresistens SB22]|uniref:Glycosyltransferase RgtA/B/C/D-like domain-containing protein n=1 Tax=Skermanella stibiiresistens SB22 TaxID=1385369 RepID=W9GWS0_9PROT|nr:hypothetical protein [Skermanella stibiiresistens]EWY38350.1 hypothetical protein N825_14165 [Skermanella stibiiresistens SB22]